MAHVRRSIYSSPALIRAERAPSGGPISCDLWTGSHDSEDKTAHGPLETALGGIQTTKLRGDKAYSARSGMTPMVPTPAFPEVTFVGPQSA
jgi:hypothetical protein